MAKWQTVNGDPDYWRFTMPCIDLEVRGKSLSAGWIGRVYPFEKYRTDLTATNADDAKAEVVERARRILTEALSGLPETGGR